MSLLFPKPPKAENDELGSWEKWATEIIRVLEFQQRLTPAMPCNSTNYQLTDVSVNRNYSVSAGQLSVSVVANALGTLIRDLRQGGIIG